MNKRYIIAAICGLALVAGSALPGQADPQETRYLYSFGKPGKAPNFPYDPVPVYNDYHNAQRYDMNRPVYRHDMAPQVHRQDMNRQNYRHDTAPQIHRQDMNRPVYRDTVPHVQRPDMNRQVQRHYAPVTPQRTVRTPQMHTTPDGFNPALPTYGDPRQELRQLDNYDPTRAYEDTWETRRELIDEIREDRREEQMQLQDSAREAARLRAIERRNMDNRIYFPPVL